VEKIAGILCLSGQLPGSAHRGDVGQKTLKKPICQLGKKGVFKLKEIVPEKRGM
jgi:hypothetical protein